MKTNMFTKAGFSVMKFCRNKARRRVIACLSAFLMVVGSAMGGTVVLNPIGGNGGAEWNTAVGATVVGDGTVATASLLAGKNAGLIDWQSLSIGGGQTLNFNGGMFYNVVSGGNASQIAGTLNANGSVWVFNPAGVSFMNGAQVNVAGLFGVAAANLANKDTLASEIDAGKPLADMSVPQLGDMMGDVSVAGGASFSGAGVALLGKSVAVQGGSEFNVGQTTFAAGGKLVVDNVEGGKVTINVGDFVDDADDIDVTVSEGAADGDTVNFAGNLDVATEGKVLFNEGVVADGSVKVGGLKKAGSEVVVSPKQLSVASGKLLQGKSVNATAAGKVAVNGSVEAVDGDVALASADEVLVNGTVSASGVTGGNVAISGNNVGNFGTIAANGTVGDAGTVRIDAANAVALGKDSSITANAGANGNGGTVEVIAQNYANLMEGSRIEAKGGAQSGNGGFVETSGYKSMNVKGAVDTTAANGKTGTWLIDPYNVDIVAEPGVSNMDTASDPYVPNATGAQIGANDIVTALGLSDVQITTTPSPDAGDEPGNLTVLAGADINFSTLSGRTLTLDAANDIAINATINGGSDNNFTATAGNAIGVNAAVSANNVTLEANAGGVAINGKITASSLIVSAGGDVTQTAAVDVGDGSVALTVGAGKNVTLNDAGNKIGSVMVNGAIDDVAGTVKVTDSDGTLALDVIKAANLEVTAAGAVSQNDAAEVSGAVSVTVADGAAVTLDNAGNKLGSVGVVGDTDAAGDVTVVDSDGDLALDGIKAANLEVEAVGNVTQTAVLDVDNGSVALTVAAGKEVLLNQDNKIGVVKVNASSSAAAGAVTVKDTAGDLVLGGVKAASLDVTAAGDVTQTAAATVTGATTVDAGTGAVTLDNAGNDFNSVGATGAAVTVKDSNGVALGDVTATDGDVVVDTVDGDITVNAGATVKSDTAAVKLTADDNVVVNGTVDAKTDATVTAAGDATVSGTVEAEGTATVTGAQNATVEAGGKVTGADATVEATAGTATGRGRDGRGDCRNGDGCWRRRGDDHHGDRDGGSRRRGERHGESED